MLLTLFMSLKLIDSFFTSFESLHLQLLHNFFKILNTWCYRLHKPGDYPRFHTLVRCYAVLKCSHVLKKKHKKDPWPKSSVHTLYLVFSHDRYWNAT